MGRSLTKPVVAALVVVGVAVVAAIAVGVSSASPRRDSVSVGSARQRASAIATTSTSPGADSSPTSMVPTPQQVEMRNAPVNAGPLPGTLPNGPAQVGATGGPYISPQNARDVALQSLDCTLGEPQKTWLTDTGCLRVDVTFFKRYADAWALRGAGGGWVYQWLADHEIYVVTVWGKMHFLAREKSMTLETTDQRTFQIDATTGDISLVGGIPLKPTTAGLVSFTPQAGP